MNKEIVKIRKIISKGRKIGDFLLKVNLDTQINLDIMVVHLTKDQLQTNKNRKKHQII